MSAGRVTLAARALLAHPLGTRYQVVFSIGFTSAEEREAVLQRLRSERRTIVYVADEPLTDPPFRLDFAEDHFVAPCPEAELVDALRQRARDVVDDVGGAPLGIAIDAHHDGEWAPILDAERADLPELWPS